MAPLAGRRFIPLWAILEHLARKSGHVYSIPMVARRTPTGFVIPMAFGDQTDWVRNVLAAGTCSIVWKGHRYEADQAEAIDREQAGDAFSGFQRRALPLIGIERFVRVRVQSPS